MEKEIDLQDLTRVAAALIESLAAELGRGLIRIETNDDFYWAVPLEDQFVVRSGHPEQPKLDIGRLSDDWEVIHGVAQSPDEAVPLSVLQLASILSYLALRVSRKE